MKTLATRTLTIAAAAFGLAAAGSPALADGLAERPTMKVSLAGIDLDTPEGQEMLDRRIDRAARSVCELDRMRIGTRIKSRTARDCYDKARASAKQQVAAIVENRSRGS